MGLSSEKLTQNYFSGAYTSPGLATKGVGDMAAGTMVIKLKDYRKMQVSLDEFSYADLNYRPVYPQAEQLSLNQIDIIQHTLDSEPGNERDRRLSVLYGKTSHMVGVTCPDTDAERFLYTIVRDYQHYALEIV